MERRVLLATLLATTLAAAAPATRADDAGPAAPSPLALSIGSGGVRADSHAPIGVMGDHMHAKGEWMVSYRFMRMAMSGSRETARIA